MKILFVQTGGTIDKDYAQVWQAYDFEITDPAFERILKRVNPIFKYRSVSALKKDSMDMTEADRELLRELCAKVPEDHIIMTHGTDTMNKTAEALSKLTGKTIVLTGAARPEHFSNSDASFNVGLALGALRYLPPGVYIAMNGVVSEWSKVHKNPGTGQFEEDK